MGLLDPSVLKLGATRSSGCAGTPPAHLELDRTSSFPGVLTAKVWVWFSSLDP